MFEKELGRHSSYSKKHCSEKLRHLTFSSDGNLDCYVATFGIMISSKWVAKQSPFKVPLKSDVKLSDILHDLHQQFISILKIFVNVDLLTV